MYYKERIRKRIQEKKAPTEGKDKSKTGSSFSEKEKRGLFGRDGHRDKREELSGDRRSNKRTGLLIDSIVKAVATGIFILSILLNVILIIVVSFLLISREKEVKISGLYGGGYIKEYIRGSESNRWEFALLDVKGIITDEASKEGLYYRESMVQGIKNRLKIIEKDSRVKALILLIDSPGGTVTASDMIYHELLTFKEKKNIPIVGYIKGVGASGAYYISSAADYLFAYPTAITGSIGVIMYNFNVKELMEKYGVRYVVIKSGSHKDLLSPFKEIDPGELEWMQGIIDELLNRFISMVNKGRKNLSAEQIKALADGRIFTASMAKRDGLIDEIGYFDDMLRYIAGLTGVTDYSVIRFKRERQLGGILDLFAVLRRFSLWSKSVPYNLYNLNYDLNKIQKKGIETFYLMDGYNLDY